MAEADSVLLFFYPWYGSSTPLNYGGHALIGDSLLGLDPLCFPEYIDVAATLYTASHDETAYFGFGADRTTVVFSVPSVSSSFDFSCAMNFPKQNGSVIYVPIGNKITCWGQTADIQGGNIVGGTYNPNNASVHYDSGVIETGTLHAWSDRTIYSPTGNWRRTFTNQKLMMTAGIINMFFSWRSTHAAGTAPVDPVVLKRFWSLSVEMYTVVSYTVQADQLINGNWVTGTPVDGALGARSGVFDYLFENQAEDPLDISPIGDYSYASTQLSDSTPNTSDFAASSADIAVTDVS